jgi:hypothetical protein
MCGRSAQFTLSQSVQIEASLPRPAAQEIHATNTRTMCDFPIDMHRSLGWGVVQTTRQMRAKS